MRWPIAAKLQLCFVVFLLLGPAATTVGKADALMPAETDKYFTGVITSIADLRERDQTSAIMVTSLFKPLTDLLSLKELRDYIASRSPLKRGKDIRGNYEYTNIGTDELKAFDKRFHSEDVLILGFRYNENWTAITELHANLTSGQL